MNNLESIEIQSARAMIEVPENCVELTMSCTVYLDGKLQVVQRTLSMKEIQTAIQKAEDGYIDEDDRFYLNEKGLELADWLDWRDEQEAEERAGY
jgi:hypothetical protein